MNNALLLQRINEAFPEIIITANEFCGDLSLTLKREDLIKIAEFLRDDSVLRYIFLENLCGVDYLGRQPRFEVVYHLLSLVNKQRICLKVGIPENDPTLPSLTSLWPTANWQEREVYDLFGLIFQGHPSLDRILLPEDWEGHPLRKDVPLGNEEVAFTINSERIFAHKIFAEE